MPTSAKPSDAQHQERIMVFIDGSNLYHVLGEVCGRHDLNFGKFAEKIAGDRDLVRTYYYNIRQDSERDPNVATEQGKFLQTMYDTPYLEVRMGVSKRHGETMVEKGVDVYMATDLVAFAFMDLYDTAIVVSGDGDFFPAIQTAKNQGKHIEVAAFDNNLSGEASNVADTVIKLNKTFFTGLWSDRRRRASTSTGPTSTRRTRSTRPSSGSRSAATAAEPEVAAESTTEDSGRRPTRRRATTSRSTSRSSGTRTTSRRRTPTRRTASSSATDSTPTPETAVVSTPTPASAPEPASVASNENGNGNGSSDDDSRSRTPVRRTPARRRVGARSTPSGGNGSDGDSGTSAPPTPPALRRRVGSTNGDDSSTS